MSPSVHPARRCDKITRAQWQAIADATHAVLETAIRYEGSTLGDGTYRNALNQAGSYQNHHRVYDKAGEACVALRRRRANRADRSGPAVDVLLRYLPAKVVFAFPMPIRSNGSRRWGSDLQNVPIHGGGWRSSAGKKGLRHGIAA